MALPKFVVLRSVYSKRYVSYKEEGDLNYPGLLQCSGVELLSPNAKIEVVPSPCGRVHLRSCFNKKFWQRWSPNHWWLVATSDEPDASDGWKSTLFEPELAGPGKLRLKHVQLQHYACLWRISAPFDSCLFAGSGSHDNDSCDLFEFIDWENIPKKPALPRFLSLQSKSNRKYMSYAYGSMKAHGFLECSGKGEELTPYIKFEAEKAKDGLVHLRCCYNNKYLVRQSPSQLWIVAMADEPEPDRTKWSCTLFKPVFEDANAKTVRFVHLQLGNYLRLDDRAECSLMLAGSDTNHDLDAFTVYDSEPYYIKVDGNTIDNVKFRLLDARIYNEESITITTQDVDNTNNDHPHTTEVELSYTDIKSSAWNSSVSVKTDRQIALNSGIPTIEGGIVKISGYFNGQYKWRDPVQPREKISTKYVLVPPNDKVTIYLNATMASYDVPFTYSQHDGKKATRNMEDGIFTGTNFYNLRFVVKKQDE